MQKYTFFWSGPFSQWAKSKFTTDGQTFNTAEQYMMYSKAKLFEDEEIATKILATSNPRVQKMLGRQVRGFDAEVWQVAAVDVVYKGNYAKFTQNPKLMKCLLATEGTVLVEASPYDKIWGIGLGENDARRIPPKQWPGTNLLGLVLTQLREDLITSSYQCLPGQRTYRNVIGGS